MRELVEPLMVGSRLVSNLMWEQRCKEGFSSPGEPPQGTAEHSHCLQAVRSQSRLLLGAVSFKKFSSDLPGCILPWEEAGRLWTGGRSATSEHIVARKLELPWQVSLETMGMDPLSSARFLPSPILTGCPGTTVGTLEHEIGQDQTQVFPKHAPKKTILPSPLTAVLSPDRITLPGVLVF